MNQLVHRQGLEAADPVQPPSGFQVRLVESSPFSCKYVLGDADENAVCCGAPTDGKSWCAYHRSIVFTVYPGRVR